MRPRHMGQNNIDRTETDHDNNVINHTFGGSLWQDIYMSAGECPSLTNHHLLATERDINKNYPSHPTLFECVID